MLDGENLGEVKFIMIIDAVKQQTENEQNKEEAIVEENKYRFFRKDELKCSSFSFRKNAVFIYQFILLFSAICNKINNE